MGFFFDELFRVEQSYPEQFSKDDIRTAIEEFLETYSPADDMNVWFDKIKAVADKLGYASDMKEHKVNPGAFRGSVADISMFLRVAVTGKTNAPDMYTVMQILGEERVRARLLAMSASL